MRDQPLIERHWAQSTMLTRLSLIVVGALAASVTALSQPAAPSRPAPRYTITDLKLPANSYCQVYAINNKGQIVGEANGHAFLWEKGRAGDLPMLNGFAGSRAVAINDRGQAVGT